MKSVADRSCQSIEPRNCVHHGLEVRIGEAARNGDYASYDKLRLQQNEAKYQQVLADRRPKLSLEPIKDYKPDNSHSFLEITTEEEVTHKLGIEPKNLKFS